MSNASKPKHRWFQFSLKGLLLLMGLAAVPLGWTVSKLQQQRVARAELREVGCLGSQRCLPEWLGTMLGDYEPLTICSVTYFGVPSKFTDGMLVHLRGLTEQQVLELEGSQVTDAGLEHIANLTGLFHVNLARTKITDRGLAHLERLTQLDYLDLAGTQVTDAGLVHLQRLTQLNALLLDDTQVTDTGLVHLEGLTNLGLLLVGGTHVTDVGVQKLKKALPNCNVCTTK